MLPATAVGMYGIINQYGLKMIGGPIGGFMSDKVHKSAAKHIRVGFLVCAVAMSAFLMVPHEMLGRQRQLDSWRGLYSGLWIYCIYHAAAVFFAPMDEVKVPQRLPVRHESRFRSSIFRTHLHMLCTEAFLTAPRA